MLLAKFAGLGLTLVAASTTAAGAVGVLPAPAQHVVATAVDAATPFTFPDSEKETKAAKEAKAAKAAKEKSNFGTTVSADATGASDGVPGVNGEAVSDAAKNKAKSDETSNGVGANTGSKGLDRARETPAAGHVPPSVPARNGAADAAGSPAANGLGTANGTPAAGKAPTGVPPVVPAGDAGSTRGPGGRVTARP